MWLRRAGCTAATAIKSWFCSLQKASQIAVVVFCLHGALVCWMMIDHWVSSTPKRSQPLIVRSVTIMKEPVKKGITSSASLPKKSSPLTTASTSSQAKKKSPSLAMPSQTKKAVTSKEAAPKKNNPESHPPAISSETLKEIEDSFSAIASAPSASQCSSSSLSCPAPLEKISMSAPHSSSYGLSLIQTLQSCLQLPEVGQIVARITVRAPGEISSIDILDARSKKNEEWLKNQLPLVELPCFNEFGIVDATLDFTITFRNVENI